MAGIYYRINKFFWPVLFFVALGLFLPGFLKPTLAAGGGQCVCQPYDAKKGFGDAVVASDINSQENCSAGSLRVERKFPNSFATVGETIDFLKKNCYGDQGDYKKCEAEVTGANEYKCSCIDTKAKCLWRPTFCCCRRINARSVKCIESNKYFNGVEYCTKNSFGSSATVASDEYVRVEVPNTNKDYCLRLSQYTADQQASQNLYKNCEWLNEKCFCDKKLSERPGEQQQAGFKAGAAKTDPGYEIKPFKEDGTCNYPPERPPGLTADELRSRVQADLDVTTFSEPEGFIGQGIRLMLMFLGSIGLILYIYAGALWMTAAGNTEQITKAKQIFLWTTLGLMVMFGSYVLVRILFKEILVLPNV